MRVVLPMIARSDRGDTWEIFAKDGSIVDKERLEIVDLGPWHQAVVVYLTGGWYWCLQTVDTGVHVRFIEIIDESSWCSDKQTLVSQTISDFFVDTWHPDCLRKYLENGVGKTRTKGEQFPSTLIDAICEVAERSRQIF